MFYVVEGAITIQCGGETFPLEKGGFIFLPRGIEHSYTIQSDLPVRLIVVTYPVRENIADGWGGFIADLESGQGERIRKPPNEDYPWKAVSVSLKNGQYQPDCNRFVIGEPK